MKIHKPVNFEEWLNLFCFTHKITATKIATQCGISPSLLSLIKKGKRPLPLSFLDNIVEHYELGKGEKEELSHIIFQNRSRMVGRTINPYTYSLTKVACYCPWTKAFMVLSAKIVNELNPEDAELLMAQMAKLYKERTNSDLHVESMKELEKSFYDQKRS